MEQQTILVVEDEAEIRELLKLYLTSQGYRTAFAADGLTALETFEAVNPDLILLDIQLPGLNGFEVCREIRKVSNVPIVYISCRSESESIIRGLELGGDDFIEKPFDPSVAMARVRANLRRAPIYRRPSTAEGAVPGNDKLFRFGKLEIDLMMYQVRYDDKEVPLTMKEIQLLAYMAEHPNQVLTTEQLYAGVWGSDSAGDTRTVAVHISTIRRKLEIGPEVPMYIQNVRGIGYKFCP